MSSKFQNKYRIDSARLKGWDYSTNAAYFVTICTRNREHFFGKINNGIMSLSSLGEIVDQEWLKSVALRPDMNLSLGEYVIMPNHFHSIIFIGENEFNTHTNTNNTGNAFGPQSKNLASIMRGFKSAVTTFARKNDLPFDWQPRFHDHIIRNEIEYNRISNYIINNPSKWNEDKFNGK